MNVENNLSETRADLAESEPKSKEQIHQEIIDKMAELGVKECPEEVVERLSLIDEHSGFNIDSEMVCEAFGNILSVFESRNPEETKLTPKQKEDGLLAAFLHDIGKSGFSSAGIDCQLCVIKLFSVKNAGPRQTVQEILTEYFPDDYDDMLAELKNTGVNLDMSMREFWDKHAWWTHDILIKYPEVFSERMILIASSHHIISGINPCSVAEDEIPFESEVIGVMEHYVDLLEERTLMVIDKYQAAMMRGGITHEGVMTYLKEVFKKYKGDKVTNLIIDVVDELGKTDSLFPKTKNKYRKGM